VCPKPYDVVDQPKAVPPAMILTACTISKEGKGISLLYLEDICIISRIRPYHFYMSVFVHDGNFYKTYFAPLLFCASRMPKEYGSALFLSVA